MPRPPVAPTDAGAASQSATWSEEQLRRGIEMLFFAYRDFTAEPDAILAEHGYGRAHHRVVYFVGRHPGLTVSELLGMLKITKQSLARVLGQLVKDGLVVSRAGTRDRRQRLLELTERGVALERRLTERQRTRFAEAFAAAGTEAVDGFCKVMLGLIDEDARTRFDGQDS